MSLHVETSRFLMKFVLELSRLCDSRHPLTSKHECIQKMLLRHYVMHPLSRLLCYIYIYIHIYFIIYILDNANPLPREKCWYVLTICVDIVTIWCPETFTPFNTCIYYIHDITWLCHYVITITCNCVNSNNNAHQGCEHQLLFHV